jgi:hypothetical protein
MCLLILAPQGHRPIQIDRTTMFRFEPLRIKKAISEENDFDDVTLSFKLTLSHLTCLSLSAFGHLFEFDLEAKTMNTVRGFYVHPCARMRGWNDLVNIYLTRLSESGVAQLPHASSVRPPLWWFTSELLKETFQRPPELFWEWARIRDNDGDLTLESSDSDDAPLVNQSEPGASTSAMVVEDLVDTRGHPEIAALSEDSEERDDDDDVPLIKRCEPVASTVVEDLGDTQEHPEIVVLAEDSEGSDEDTGGEEDEVSSETELYEEDEEKEEKEMEETENTSENMQGIGKDSENMDFMNKLNDIAGKVFEEDDEFVV